MGAAHRHWLTIGGGLLLVAPLWGALRLALELSGNAAWLGADADLRQTGAIIAVLLDPPGWAIALLLAMALLLFYCDARLWQSTPEPILAFARKPVIARGRKTGLERGHIGRRDQNGALQPTLPPTAIQYPRALRAPGGDRPRAAGPAPVVTLTAPDFLTNDLPFDTSDRGFISTASLFERSATKDNDIGFRSAASLLNRDKGLSRAEAALFPPAVGIFRHLSNEDLRQHTASMAQALRLFEQKFSDNDNEKHGTAVTPARHGYHPNAVELAAEILHRVGRIPIPKDDISVIGGAIVLQMGGPMGAWPFNSAANFLEFISAKLVERNDVLRSPIILHAQ
jgi:hypothetical protein